MPCEVVLLRVGFFQNGCRCHRNDQNAKKMKKNKNDHNRFLAEQKLMKLKRRIIIRNGANTICLPNFVWEP
jgi:hypothetical protein